MQKLLSALVAVLSFTGMLSGMTIAPTAAQQVHSPGVPTSPDPLPSVAANPGVTEPLVLRPGVTNENVEVKDRPLVIEGDVKGSVHAVNSNVTMMPGAKVEGGFSMEGGSISVAPVAGIIGSVRNRPSAPTPQHNSRKGDWFGGQFCLWLLGLAGGLIVLIAAPQATTRVTETVSLRPGRSLLAGTAVSAAMFAALAVSGMILNTRSFLSLLWMPFTIVIALVSLFLLTFGWLAGMQRVGDLLARKFGQTGSGTFYGRMALGLSAFFVFNGIIGGLVPPLGAAGLLVEFAVAVMGIGAIVQTGFRRDDAWQGGGFGRGAGLG